MAVNNLSNARMSFEITRMFDEVQDMQHVWANVQDIVGMRYQQGMVDISVTPEQLMVQLREAWEASKLDAIQADKTQRVILAVGRHWKNGLRHECIEQKFSATRRFLHFPADWSFDIQTIPENTPNWMKRK